MAVSIVGTPKTPAGGITKTINPTVSLGSVTANDWLFALVAQASTADVGTPTDAPRNDTFSFLTGIQPRSDQPPTINVFYAPRVKGGNTTVTLPTVADSTYVCAELAGCAVPTQIQTARGLAFDAATVPSAATSNCSGLTTGGLSEIPVLGANGALVVALIVSAVQTSFTFLETGWTHAGSGSELGLCWDAWLLNITNPAPNQPTTAFWNIDTPGPASCLAASFPAA